MNDSGSDPQAELPRNLASLAAFMDGLPPSEQQAIIWRLGPAQVASEAARDETLTQAIGAEHNAYQLYGNKRSLAVAVGDAQAHFDEPMIDYLRTRKASDFIADAAGSVRARHRRTHQSKR